MSGRVTIPAHHLVGMDLGFTCTNCGGHTSTTAPCIPARTYAFAVAEPLREGPNVEPLARLLWLADGYDLDADPESRTAREVRPGFMEMAESVAKHLTSEPALAAFREAWQQADADGAEGDRVRRGMVAAIEAVSS